MTLKKKESANIKIAPETAADDDNETSHTKRTPASLGPLVASSEAPLPPLGEADAVTIVHQLIRTQPVPSNLAEQSQIGIARGAVAHYQAIGPRDGLESALARAVVGLNNGMMDCLGRVATNKSVPEIREIDMRLGIKAALALAEVVKAFDNHRGRHQPKVAVGQLNVAAGGQALVANIERHDHANREIELRCATTIETEGGEEC